MKWLLSDIATALGGELVGADQTVLGVSSDSRRVAAGQLFIVLVGERFDAHDFLPDVQAAGAVAALVSDKSRVPAGLSAVCVVDTRLALGQLAAVWRARFEIPVIGVTGSNGKTTTKEMIASILKAEQTRRGRGAESVLATQGNLNNDIGLPLTLLGLTENHRAAVIEMGMNHPGEIAYLAEIARPTAAVVTNAQRAHLEGMGNLDSVAVEKGTIYSGLKIDGVAAIAADSPFVGLWRMAAGGRKVLTYAETGAADLRAEIVQRGLAVHLLMTYQGQTANVALKVPGRHNARNALAAAAVCLAAGASWDAVSEGLAQFAGVKGRLQQQALPNGAVLLDDTYNANPDSVRAGIDVLASTVGRKILVLGDMGEIGEAAAQYHDEVGGYAKRQGVDFLLAMGDATQQAVRCFGEGAQFFRQPEALISALQKNITAETTVLVKGSRFMRMERVSEGLLAAMREQATQNGAH